MVGWHRSWVNARFWARMATAQFGFHHGTGGWRAIPEDCGILALAAVKMALVKCCAIALTSSKDASERCMDARNLTQSALAKIQCGACSRAGLGVERWTTTGKWSLPWRSLTTVQSRWGTIDRLQRAKSMEEVEPVAMQICVGSPVFKRTKLLARRSCSRSAPLWQVRLEPQTVLWPLKSPTMMKGGWEIGKQIKEVCCREGLTRRKIQRTDYERKVCHSYFGSYNWKSGLKCNQSLVDE